MKLSYPGYRVTHSRVHTGYYFACCSQSALYAPWEIFLGMPKACFLVDWILDTRSQRCWDAELGEMPDHRDIASHAVMQSSKVESMRCIEVHLRGCMVESMPAKDVLFVLVVCIRWKDVLWLWGCNTTETLWCVGPAPWVKTGSIVYNAFFFALAQNCLVLCTKAPLQWSTLKLLCSTSSNHSAC